MIWEEMRRELVVVHSAVHWTCSGPCQLNLNLTIFSILKRRRGEEKRRGEERRKIKRREEEREYSKIVRQRDVIHSCSVLSAFWLVLFLFSSLSCYIPLLCHSALLYCYLLCSALLFCSVLYSTLLFCTGDLHWCPVLFCSVLFYKPQTRTVAQEGNIDLTKLD